MSFYGWKPYIPVAERHRQAEREAAKIRKKGSRLAPVVLTGSAIARTFWGKAWCDNLERYSDYANRLPRGRTYVRNGSVIDLKIEAGEVKALVSGSSIYKVNAKIAALAPARWKALCSDCAGAIDSLVELLQARFSQGVMERMCRQQTGLFPSPKEISFTCSCPDWASMCKHVAAVFYGIGARLDQKPELLFELRKVDHTALIATAGADLTLGGKGPAAGRVLADPGLAEIFGIEFAGPVQGAASLKPKRRAQEISEGSVQDKAKRKRVAPSRARRTPPATKRGSSTAGKKPKGVVAGRSGGAGAGHKGMQPKRPRVSKIVDR
jgi:uncharacterized Zn finger protein